MKNTSWSESSNLNIPHMLKSTCQFQVFEASVPPTHPLSAQKCSDRSPPQVIIFPDRFYEEEQFLRKASSISCSSKVQFLRFLQTDFTDNCSARLGSMHVCAWLQLGQVYCWLLDTYSRCTICKQPQTTHLHNKCNFVSSSPTNSNSVQNFLEDQKISEYINDDLSEKPSELLN